MVDHVRSLKRGLDILKYVSSNGGARASELASSLRLPRGTVYRLLETLVEEGYVGYFESEQCFRVTNLARTLGDGVRARTTLAQIIKPLMLEYARILVWPIDFLIYQNGSMVVAETTHGSSPMSIDHGMAGRQIPILRTAAGRAYLAHVSEGERTIIIEHIRRMSDPDDVTFLEEKRLETMLRKVKAAGVAVRISGDYRPATSGMSVPILHDGGVVGCVSVIWIRKAVTAEQAMATCADPLRELAARAMQAMDRSLLGLR